MMQSDARLLTAQHFSHVRNCVDINRAAVKEMHRQVGDLVVSAHGIARRGLLVRHLVLPEHVSGTDEVLSFLAEEISPDTYVNIMDQYRPCYRADENPPLDHRIARGEFQQAKARAAELGLHRFG